MRVPLLLCLLVAAVSAAPSYQGTNVEHHIHGDQVIHHTGDNIEHHHYDDDDDDDDDDDEPHVEHHDGHHVEHHDDHHVEHHRPSRRPSPRPAPRPAAVAADDDDEDAEHEALLDEIAAQYYGMRRDLADMPTLEEVEGTLEEARRNIRKMQGTYVSLR